MAQWLDKFRAWDAGVTDTFVLWLTRTLISTRERDIFDNLLDTVDTLDSMSATRSAEPITVESATGVQTFGVGAADIGTIEPIPAKPHHSIKLTPGKVQQFMSALADLKLLYGVVAAEWNNLPQWQREAILLHSPVLAAYQAFWSQFGVTENG